jgi:hypothetical protein
MGMRAGQHDDATSPPLPPRQNFSKGVFRFDAPLILGENFLNCWIRHHVHSPFIN